MMTLLKFIGFVIWVIITIGYIFFNYDPGKVVIALAFVAFTLYLFGVFMDSLAAWLKKKVRQIEMDKRCKHNHFSEKEEFDEVRPHVD